MRNKVLNFCLSASTVITLASYLFSCDQTERQIKDGSNTIDLSEVRSLVMHNYEENDSIYFTPQENCGFMHYLNNELENTSTNYDVIYGGFWIKYFHCPYNDFSFTVIKGPDDKLNYIGFTDLVYYQNLVNEKYLWQDTQFEKTQPRLELLKNDFSVSGYFNEFFQGYSIFSQLDTLNKYPIQTILHAQSLIYLSYRNSTPGYLSVYESIFNSIVEPEEVESELIKLDVGEERGKEFNEVYNFVYPLTYQFLDRRMFLYKLINRGLLGIVVEVINGKIQMSEILIPETVRRHEPESDLPNPC